MTPQNKPRELLTPKGDQINIHSRSHPDFCLYSSLQLLSVHNPSSDRTQGQLDTRAALLPFTNSLPDVRIHLLFRNENHGKKNRGHPHIPQLLLCPDPIRMPSLKGGIPSTSRLKPEAYARLHWKASYKENNPSQGPHKAQCTEPRSS